jgi:hypothetical protein
MNPAENTTIAIDRDHDLRPAEQVLREAAWEHEDLHELATDALRCSMGYELEPEPAPEPESITEAREHVRCRWDSASRAWVAEQ